jgi:hypothetical protein
MTVGFSRPFLLSEDPSGRLRRRVMLSFAFVRQLLQF